MDPLNPITPSPGLMLPVTRAPAVPRVSRDEQRDRTRDERWREEQDDEDEESFEQTLDEVVEDAQPAPGQEAVPADTIADAVTIADDRPVPAEFQAGPNEPPVAETETDIDIDIDIDRRPGDEDSNGSDQQRSGPHIDISA